MQPENKDNILIVDSRRNWLEEETKNDDDFAVEVDLSQIEEELFDESTSEGLLILNEALENFLSLNEDTIRREIDAALGAAGGPPPKNEFPVSVVRTETFRPKFLFMARCKHCGWPGEELGVEIFASYSKEDAIKHATNLHDNAWDRYNSELKCPHAPIAKCISSENEDF